ncbi:hypothetical protein V6N13_132438 [Hibiscus sabdariffa]
MPSATQPKWRVPRENEVKVNFDSTFIQQSMRSVSGVICRDDEGFILAACSLTHLSVRDAFMAEALSCLQAVTFAWELGFTRVVVEGDSHIKSFSRAFTSVTFCFVHRAANMAAHNMSHEGKAFDYPIIGLKKSRLARCLLWRKID